MTDSLLFPIILQAVGVIVVIAEIILPSGGLLSVVALGAFGYSLFIVFRDISTTAGVAFVAADIVLVPVCVIVGLKLLARSPVTLRRTLSRGAGYSSQSPDMDGYLNMRGTAVTNLRPAGTAVLNGKRVDVVTRGEHIEKNAEVVVCKVTGNQIIVRKQDPS